MGLSCDDDGQSASLLRKVRLFQPNCNRINATASPEQLGHFSADWKWDTRRSGAEPHHANDGLGGCASPPAIHLQDLSVDEPRQA
jgi:hypothetical protein